MGANAEQIVARSDVACDQVSAAVGRALNALDDAAPPRPVGGGEQAEGVLPDLGAPARGNPLHRAACFSSVDQDVDERIHVNPPPVETRAKDGPFAAEHLA